MEIASPYESGQLKAELLWAGLPACDLMWGGGGGAPSAVGVEEVGREIRSGGAHEKMCCVCVCPVLVCVCACVCVKETAEEVFGLMSKQWRSTHSASKRAGR